jgi:hypothetical protein
VMLSPKPSPTSSRSHQMETSEGHIIDRARSDGEDVQREQAEQQPVVRECPWTVRGKPGPDRREALDQDPEDRVRIVVVDNRERARRTHKNPVRQLMISSIRKSRLSSRRSIGSDIARSCRSWGSVLLLYVWATTEGRNGGRADSRAGSLSR